MEKKLEITLPDPCTRRIYFTTEIDSDSSCGFIEKLDEISDKDDELFEENQRMLNQIGLSFSNYKFPSINVYLNSPGGYVYDDLLIYDHVRSNTNNINITCSGMVASAAIIFLCSVPLHNRVCTKNTTFLIHQAAGGVIGTTKDIEDELTEMKRLTDITFNIIVENTKITHEQLDDVYEKKRDWIMTAEEALKYGLVSKII